ncbi:hypothetical protein FKM82_019920 [Ascaphus truei]
MPTRDTSGPVRSLAPRSLPCGKALFDRRLPGLHRGVYQERVLREQVPIAAPWGKPSQQCQRERLHHPGLYIQRGDADVLRVGCHVLERSPRVRLSGNRRGVDGANLFSRAVPCEEGDRSTT